MSYNIVSGLNSSEEVTQNPMAWTYATGAIGFIGILANTLTFIYFATEERYVKTPTLNNVSLGYS